jgi:hypothetical protein
MLRRYHIISLDDLRAAAVKGSHYTGELPASRLSAAERAE